jgi:hypothetical protein
VVRKKTWNKSKYREFICGYCNWCKKELLNTMGGWIINGEKKHFCHDGRDGSCFDKYCHIKKEAQCQDTMEKR